MDANNQNQSDPGPPTAPVIEASRWLEARVDSLVEREQYGDAIGYLRMLWPTLKEDDDRRGAAMTLGYLYLLAGDLQGAEEWLRRTESLQSGADDPDRLYAAGVLARDSSDPARSALFFLEGFVEAQAPQEEAEFLRSAALALLEFTEEPGPLVAMLLGALDRDGGNPYILDALSRVYAAQGRWMETLETLSRLARVVEEGARALVPYRNPSAHEILKQRLLGRPTATEEVHRRAREINRAVRAEFELVLDESNRRGETGLAALRSPPSLRRMLDHLEERHASVQVTETAHTLWALSAESDLRTLLGQRRTAAALHVLVERLHWRHPTPFEDLAELHRVPEASIPAAARVIAGRLELRPLDHRSLISRLPPTLHERLDDLLRALLFGEGLAEVRAQVIRLG